MMHISVTRTTCPNPKPDTSKLGFGTVFTDHMFLMDYSPEKGWHGAHIVPFGPLSLHPAATVFHYGAEVFEGLKAYRRDDGCVQLFRPVENLRRLNRSAERLCLPAIPEEMGLEILSAFVGCEQDWVPSDAGTSLYLRPFLFGNDTTLGVHPVACATFVIIASPVGHYYRDGMKPLRIRIEDEDVRAVRGGTGYAKCGGNYAAANRAGVKAGEQGFSQVLWLDGVERRYIEEVGAMNVMFKIGGEIITPALSGSILPGITRKSCLEILRGEGYNVTERLISVDELIKALTDGTLEEAWGTGTAAVVSPIGAFGYRGKTYSVQSGEIGPVTEHIYEVLTGIQWGRIPDPHGWTYEIPRP